jgi:hypothetical protein
LCSRRTCLGVKFRYTVHTQAARSKRSSVAWLRPRLSRWRQSRQSHSGPTRPSPANVGALPARAAACYSRNISATLCPSALALISISTAFATTPDLALARLHGCNAKKWYGRFSNASERFDYLYSEQELNEWAPNVQAMAEAAEVVHVLFNKNYNDYALENARQMRMILREELREAEIVAPPQETD